MTTRETVMKMNSKLHTCGRKYFTAILMTMLMLLTAQGAQATIFHFIDLEGNVAFVYDDKETNGIRSGSINFTLGKSLHQVVI